MYLCFAQKLQLLSKHQELPMHIAENAMEPTLQAQ